MPSACPCPVYLIIIVFKHAQCMPRSVPASIALPALPDLIYPIIIIFKHAQCMPRSVPAPAVQFISCSPPPPYALSSGSVHLMLLPPPPCPVYLLIIVFKHAQCMPRSVPAPMPLPPFPPPAVQFISCSSPPPHAPSIS